MDNVPDIAGIPFLDQVRSEAEREKAIRWGHISTLHLWWGRLPNVTARAAVYLALTEETGQELPFLDELCVYPGDPAALLTAQDRILQIHAARMPESVEPSASKKAEHASRPRVLDPFSGSGTIPLEALRLGCGAFAVDLNPVAYLIQLCTLVYPQRVGLPDPESKGSAPDGTWAGLRGEIAYWNQLVHERVREEIGALYPPVGILADGSKEELGPFAYLWARTIRCSNPACGATLPLVQQAWLAKKRGRYVALRPILDHGARRVHYDAVEADTPEGLGFEPQPTVRRGEASCPFCGTHLTSEAIHDAGQAGRLGVQLLAAICRDSRGQRVYRSGSAAEAIAPAEDEMQRRVQELCRQTGLTPPEEPLPDDPAFGIKSYGFGRYRDLFTTRQVLALLTYAKYIRYAHDEIHTRRVEPERAKAIATYLALLLDRLVNWSSALCSWQFASESVLPTLARPSLSMAWDFIEINPFSDFPGAMSHTDQFLAAVDQCIGTGLPARVECASATKLPFDDEFFDAIVTDAPQYDKVPYADLSDFFYVWLNRTVGQLYPAQFTSALTPKQAEVIVAPGRHGPDRETARRAYEERIQTALAEAARVLKTGRLLTMILLVKPSVPGGFEAFLELAQRAGFELFSARKIELARILASQDVENRMYQVLLTFRKTRFKERLSEASADAEAVLQLVEEGKPTLCVGLADLLLKQVSREILDACIPPDYKGTLDAKLREYVADCEDPGELLEDMLGGPGMITAARALGLAAPDLRIDPSAACDRILTLYGFNIPEPPREGPLTAIEEIRNLAARVTLAREKTELRGQFMTAMTLIERTLRQAAWAWGHAVFGKERDEQFGQILEGKSLNILSMGDVKRVYCELPEHVGRSVVAERSQVLFGRPYPYKPKKQIKDLDVLVAMRNTVEHNKEGYMDVTPLSSMKVEFAAVLARAYETLDALSESGALPMIVKPVRETTDMYGRRSVELQLEDNTKVEVYLTHPLKLGSYYFYFKPETNPRPLDPPLYLLSDVMGG